MDTLEKEERIQQQMAETRASLADKLETLEQKVIGTVEGASSAVNETVETIKETVQETVTTAKETVKESVETVKDLFDLHAHFQAHPWLMFGGSVAVGYCLAAMLERQSAPLMQPSILKYGIPAEPVPNGQREEHITATAPPPESKWAPELAKLKSLALGALFGTAREMVASSIPDHMAEQVRDIIDGVTRKMGADPIPSADWEQAKAQTSPPEEEQYWPGHVQPVESPR